MPARRIPPEEREIREQLFDRYGGYLSRIDVQTVIGTRNQSVLSEWLSDVPYTTIGKRRKWSAAAIARKLWANTEVLNVDC